MNEGWLFRLRSSLGSHQSVPAWPSARTDETSTLPPLRRPPVANAMPIESTSARTFGELVAIETAIDETR